MTTIGNPPTLSLKKRHVELRYKCRCMDAEAGVQMLERGAGEDIEVFMLRVAGAVSADHRKRSVLCNEATTEYVKIPVGRAKGGTA